MRVRAFHAEPVVIAKRRRFVPLATTITITLAPAGILGAESLGSQAAAVAATLAPAGVPTAEVKGSEALSVAAAIACAGILTGELLGGPTSSVVAAIACAGILTGELLGGPTSSVVVASLAAAGIPSAESLASQAASPAFAVAPIGVPAAEVLGRIAAGVTLAIAVAPVGVASAEATGHILVSTVVPGSLPEDLLSALQQIFDASASASAITGMYTQHVPDEADLPFATVEERSSRIVLRTSTSTLYQVDVAVRVYDAKLDTAGRLGDQLRDDLKGQRPSFVGGIASPLLISNEPRHSRETGRVRGGRDAWYQDRILTTSITRPKQ